MSLVLRSFLPHPNSCLGTSPYQQGRDTKMTQRSFCGIDVAKDRLDVMVLPEELCWSVVNDAAGWAELVAFARVSGAPRSGRTGFARAEAIETALRAAHVHRACSVDKSVGPSHRAEQIQRWAPSLISRNCKRKAAASAPFSKRRVCCSSSREGEAFRGVRAPVCCRFPAKAAKRRGGAPPEPACEAAAIAPTVAPG